MGTGAGQAQALKAGIVQSARGGTSFCGAEHLPLNQRHVFAEREVPPVRCVSEGGAIDHQPGKTDFAHQRGNSRVHQGPDVERVLRHVGARRDGGLSHFS